MRPGSLDQLRKELVTPASNSWSERKRVRFNYFLGAIGLVKEHAWDIGRKAVVTVETVADGRRIDMAFADRWLRGDPGMGVGYGAGRDLIERERAWSSTHQKDMREWHLFVRRQEAVDTSLCCCMVRDDVLGMPAAYTAEVMEGQHLPGLRFISFDEFLDSVVPGYARGHVPALHGPDQSRGHPRSQ
jgi:hypothetical protein